MDSLTAKAAATRWCASSFEAQLAPTSRLHLDHISVTFHMKVEETTVTAFWLSAGGWDGESELLYETGALDGDVVSV